MRESIARVSVHCLLPWLLVTLLLALASPAAGKAGEPGGEIVLTDGVDLRAIGQQIEFLEDRSGLLTITEVASPAMTGRFSRSDQDTPNFGLGDTVYWLRFRVADRSAVPREWLLEQRYPLMRSFDLYLPQPDSTWRVQGFGRDDDILPHRNPLFTLPLQHAPTTFYVRAAVGSIVTFPLVVQTRDHFLTEEGAVLLAYGLYFGFMLTMALYNTYLYYLLRDRVYLYFVAYLISFSILQMSLHGFLRQYLFPGVPHLDNQVLRMFIIIPAVASLCFSRRFLNSRQYAPLLDRCMIGLIALEAALLPIDPFLPLLPALILLNLLTLIAPILATATGFVCYHQGFRPARYYLAARICLYVSLCIFTVNNIVFHHHTFWSWYGMMLGSFLEVLFLSGALAERISGILRDKEQVESEAVRASGLALVGEMAAGVAHEVNNPLAGVILCFREILALPAGDPERDDLIRAVESGLGKIRNTIAHFLTFSRMTVSEIRPATLAPLIDDALTLCRYQLEQGQIEATFTVDPALPAVSLDQTRMEQVLVNLILNASHAMPDGGSLVICAARDGDWCALSITDTGTGIPPEVLPRVFEPFFTTKPSGRGTGLGLSLCKTIVDAHGGTIVLESGPGGGTVCRIRLPLRLKAGMYHAAARA